MIYSKGFGVTNAEYPTPVTTDTLFMIGSTTKLFTATALVDLAESGKLRLDDPLSQLVSGLGSKLAQVTPYQLLTHTSGLCRNQTQVQSQAVKNGPREAALESYVRSIRDDQFFATPEKVFSYSNLGFSVAGFLIEQLSGKPYSAVMQERILQPLGMSRSTFDPLRATTYLLAQGHQASGQVVRPFEENAGELPVGYLLSTVNDLSRFAVAFLNEGKIEGKQLLSSAVIRAFAAPRVDVVTRYAEGKYGYGLFVYKYRGVNFVEHGGATSGFICTFRLAPEQRLAVILLANKGVSGGGTALPKTVERAMEMLLPLMPKESGKPRRVLPMTEEELSRYTGRYANNPAKIEIVAHEGRLFWRVGDAKKEDQGIPIEKVGPDQFEIVAPGGATTPFKFVPGPDGRAAFIHIALLALGRSDR